MKRETLNTVMALMLALECAVCAASGAVSNALPKNFGQRPVMAFGDARKAFSEPGMAFAPFVFWFWDEPLDPAKMAEMSRVMLSQGFNPGYAHARRSMVGTPDLPDDNWLTDRWFDAFGAALKEAEKGGGYLGYCDEYWWPSFQAHGRVLKAHPELRAESLKWEVIDAAGSSEIMVPESFFAVAARLDRPVPSIAEALPEMGKWIWDPNGTQTKHTCWFRKIVDIPAGRSVAKAVIQVTVDNGYALFVNGTQIGTGDSWSIPGIYDVTGKLSGGRNVLAVQGSNLDGPFGMILGMTIKLDDGSTISVVSDSSWRTTLRQPAGDWMRVGFDDSGWVGANEICAADEGPWAGQGIGGGGRGYERRTILSKTLRVIGSGGQFTWKVPDTGTWRVYVFNRYYHAGAFDGEQANTIDERLGKAFAEIALEPYAKRMGDKLGKSIPGDFIDNEGDYGWQLAWSGSLDQKYKQRHGRDIRLWMPLMLDQDVEGLYAKARWEWFDLVSDLYSANFRVTTDWNERHGAYTTAHVWEESIPAQVSCVGDHMKLLRALTMPGQDCLGTKALFIHDFKEDVSVAEFGNTRATTELMGAGGWGVFTPEFLKQSVNAVTAWGISHIIPHGVFTTRKLTGNPWMPDWYSENPMFPWMHLWTDFVRRASFVNSLGHASPDVLLYNPLESAWILASGDMLDVDMWTFSENSPEGRQINAIDRSYCKAIQDLTDGRVEFLIGDRKYVSEMTVKGSRLVRGPLEFKTVVLPPLRIMPLNVARKIVEFAKAGGRVYALGSLPDGSADNGMGDPEMSGLMKELSGLRTFTRCEPEPADCRAHWNYGPGWVYETDASKHGLKPLIEKQAPGLESPVRFVVGSFPMLQSHRRVDGRDFFWLVNNSETDTRNCEVLISGAHGEASIWDCETGQTRPAASRDRKDGSLVALTFKPLEAYWLVLDPKRPVGAKVHPEVTQVVATVDGPWTVKCDLSAQPAMENPMKPDETLVTGVEKPLEDWSAWGLKGFSGLMDYSASVRLGRAGGRIRLDLGTVHSAAQVWVNDKPCGMRLWGPYEFDVSGAARTGINEIRVRVANQINNSYGDTRESGLRGPVRLIEVK